MNIKYPASLLILAASATILLADDNKSATDATNTDRNRADRTGETATPFDQSNAKADLDVTAAIRKELVANSSLTMTAKNVKVITANNTVVLRGPVSTPEEKTTIETIARKNAGSMRVENQLEIAAK